jgi:hypothetical protein
VRPHSTTGRTSAKARHCKTKGPKRGNTSSAARRTSSSVSELQNQVSALTRELAEARKQQTATSEVLRVINSTPGDLAPVFDEMTQKALELCGAAFGGFWLVEGGIARAVATHNVPAPFDEFLSHEPTPVEQIVGRNSDRPFVQAPDLRETASYRNKTPLTVAAVDLAGIRTFIAVPLRREGLLVGIFAIYRQEVRPFSEQEIALVQNFAAQAVIAIENARLLTELREALAQQTATADVLKVISSSPGAVEPVFAKLLENATRLCDAHYGNMWLNEADAFRSVAFYGTLPSTYIQRLGVGAVMPPDPLLPAARGFDQATLPIRRYPPKPTIPRRSSVDGFRSRPRGHSRGFGRADAQGKRGYRRHCNLQYRSAAIH